MRYSNQINGQQQMLGNPSILPNDAAMTNASLTQPANPQAPIMSEPRPYNPGIKATGAPVNFNPKAQASMTGMFGMPNEGSYDRTLSTPSTF
jgi:hypothetical protein